MSLTGSATPIDYARNQDRGRSVVAPEQRRDAVVVRLSEAESSIDRGNLQAESTNVLECRQHILAKSSLPVDGFRVHFLDQEEAQMSKKVLRCFAGLRDRL